jgi:hypothetical protein
MRYLLIFSFFPQPQTAHGRTLSTVYEKLSLLKAPGMFTAVLETLNLPDRMHDTQSMPNCPNVVFNPTLVPGGDEVELTRM